VVDCVSFEGKDTININSPINGICFLSGNKGIALGDIDKSYLPFWESISLSFG